MVFSLIITGLLWVPWFYFGTINLFPCVYNLPQCKEVERQHPYSEWSRRAILMTAYAHYMGNDYAEAIADSDRFISLYPGNVSTPYAYYLKAICYFEQIVDVGRDQANASAAGMRRPS